MYHNKQITYKGRQIRSAKSIRKLITLERRRGKIMRFREKRNEEKETFSYMLRYEHILHQKQSSIAVDRKEYTFKEMLQVQNYLKALDFLETIKYAKNTVNARQLIRNYLYNAYSLSPTSTADLKCSVKEDDILSQNDIISHALPPHPLLDEKGQPSLCKSIREYIYKYLSFQCDALESPSSQCGLFSSMECHHEAGNGQTKNTRMQNGQILTAKRRFLLPVSEIPEFLLLFTFFDGHNFNPHHSIESPQKLPPFKDANSCSDSSYRNVLKEFQKHFSSASASPYSLATTYRCDNIFLFRKLNMLYYYYKLYSSNAMLDKIVSGYLLTYQETMKLKKTILIKIFKDEEFIISGLKSPYLDFMLPFDIFFQCIIPHPASRHLVKLKEDIAKCKEKALTILKDTSFLSHNSPLFYDEDTETFSIQSCEDKIYHSLKKNPFFVKYYDSHDDFSDSFINGNDSKDCDSYFFSLCRKIICKVLAQSLIYE